jgi:mono/diheme cytochrome c family protein
VRFKHKLVIFLALGVAVIALTLWRIMAVSSGILERHYAQPAEPLAAPVARADVKDGERLARMDGCFSCHGKQLTGRVLFTGPLGTRLVAPNLTRVIRKENDAQLATAIRYGIRPDGTTLINMPSTRFLASSDQDIAAIIAYLRTLNELPDATPATRWGLEGRILLAMHFFRVTAESTDTTARGPRLTPTEPIALGRYLTRSQCSACHGRDLKGDPEESSPDLRFSLKHYSQGVFERFFTTGVGRKGHGTHTMTPLIKRQFRYLTKADVEALYAYLSAPAAK